MNIEITDQQAENTRVAYSIMAGIPAERIDLDVIRSKKGEGDNQPIGKKQLFSDCGTIACIGGWLSAHPYFQEQGLKFSKKDAAANLEIDVDLFGDTHEFYWMFDSSQEYGEMGQKAEALARLRKHLLHAGRITKERNRELKKYEKTIT